MPPKNGSTKETKSFSVRSNTLEALDAYCAIFEIDNLSNFVDSAIREKIGRGIAENPLAWSKLKKFLSNFAS